MTHPDSGTIQPAAAEYDPIHLQPRPTPHPSPHPSPTSPMAPTPTPDSVAEPVPTELAAAATFTATFLLSPGQAVNPNDIKSGTKVYRLDKIRADGSMKRTIVKNPTITVTAGGGPSTYQIQIATTDANLHGKLVFVTVVLPALGKAGVATSQFS
jgi:hypothetical protein